MDLNTSRIVNLEQMNVVRPAEITATQSYSRAGMGYLWNKRGELDAGQVKILNAIYNNRKKKDIDCKQTITYKLSRSKIGQLGYGRYYSSIGGLETVEKECRGTLCKDLYYDIDIVNCHPVLLSQFIKNKFDWTIPSLDHYIANRDEVLAKISDNRDAAKEEMIRIMYGGKNTHEYTATFAADVSEFTKLLAANGMYRDLWETIKADDSSNKYGRFLSFVLQTEEASCMLVMKEAFEADGWSVDVLCYDGLMIRKREGVSYEASLRNAEAAIKAKLNYDIKLVNKEFTWFDVPKITEEISKGVSRSQYDEMKADFERTHFYHIPSDTIAELKDNGEVSFMKKPHAYSYLDTLFFFPHSDKFADNTSFLGLWLKDTTRRCIEFIDFKESSDPKTFTIPLKFAYEDAVGNSATAVELFMELISIIAKDEQKEYLLDYLAHLVQKPLENPKVALVITGLKGCGKDTLFDFLSQYVVGHKYSRNYDSNEQFFDKHDLGRQNKFLVKLEEADVLICKKNASNLKARITSNYSSFNPKGLNSFEAPNYCRNIFTTNMGNPFEMNGGERRFSIFNANISRKGDFPFWTRIRSELFTEAAGATIAEFLKARDISNWSSFNMPISEYQMAVVASEATSEESFVNQWDGQPIDATEFFQQYRSYCVENSLPHAQNSMSLGKRLLSLLRDGLILKKKTKTSYQYSKA